MHVAELFPRHAAFDGKPRDHVVSRQPNPRKPTRLFVAALSLLALTACKGGSGAVGVSTYFSPYGAPAPVDGSVLSAAYSGALGAGVAALTTALLQQTDYLRQNTPSWFITLNDGTHLTGLNSYPLRSSGAAFAHAAGLSGTGAIIAISDGHISPGHEAFAGSPARIEVVSNGTTPSEHGTSVASIAAGKSSTFIGTAPEAHLVFGTYETDQALADLGNYAADLGAVAWNNSWGFPSLDLNQQGFNDAFLTTPAGQNYLAALTRFAASGVVVFAASNDNTLRHSTLMDGLPYLEPGLEAGWIAAVNGVPTMSGGNVTSVRLLSAGCYESARWCLIADGAWESATGSGSAYDFGTGTSFAAPQISGALALLAEAFPGLSPHELRIRLFASADDGFFTADDTVELADGFFKGYSVIYGMGFLDIEAALKPIGGTAMAMAAGGSVSTNTAILNTGSALGDAVERSLAGTDVAVKDALSAGFIMPAAALTAGARPSPQAATLLAHSLRGNLRAERVALEKPLAEPFAAYSTNTATLTEPEGMASASVMMPVSGNESLGVNLTRALTDGPTRIELGLKVARDGSGTFGLSGDDSALIASVALGVTQSLGDDGFLSLSGEIGMTDLGGATALTKAGTARFDSMALKIGSKNVFADGDKLTLALSMPVAIASGRTEVNLPVARSAGAGFETMDLNLAPQDRQMDLTVSYQTALADGLEMKLSLVRSKNFGNRAGERDAGGALAFTFRF